VTNVRIVEDKLTKAPKGFGYVEFETLDGLQKALDLSGTTLQGRTIRTSVAEPRKYFSNTSFITRLMDDYSQGIPS
jgi:translation initiation factor 4B